MMILNNDYIRSPIFYMGNKLKLLPKLLPLFPKNINCFWDLFGGSGCVSMNIRSNRVVYSEINRNIVNLHKMFLDYDADYIDHRICEFIKQYDLNPEGVCIQQNRPDVAETRKHYEQNYLKFRDAYNKSQNDIFMLYTLTFYSFSNLIRFNSNNEFNMPFGNRCYTEEHRFIIHRWCQTLKERPVDMFCRDAFDILESCLTPPQRFDSHDFVYLDPPYSQTTAIYNEQRAFGGWQIDDDFKLFRYLEQLDKLGIRWGLSNVFKNKDFINQHLIDWCESSRWNVRHLDFTYSSLGKGNANSDEVYIFNYETDVPAVSQFRLF